MSTHENRVRHDHTAEPSPTTMMPNSGAAGALDTTHVVSDLQAVNEQLLLAGLRDQAWTDALRDQLAFTHAITRSLSEGVYALNCVGQLTTVNPALEQMLGSTETDLLGKHVDTVIPMHTAQGVAVVWEGVLLQQLIQSGTSYQNVDVRVTRPDGTSFPAISTAAPLVINEEVVGIAVSLRDMTDVQRLRQIQDEYVTLLSREHSQLEALVRERTGDLERANALLQAEVGERTRSEQARQRLIQQLVTAQEEERRRIARELHDQMGQTVTALMLAIKVVRDRIGDAPDLQHHLVALHALGSQLGQDVRTLAVQLRPPALDHLGLLPTLTTYIEQWSTQALVVADLYTTGLEHTRLPHSMETTVFRVVQEALTNIMRHAQASSVSVILHRRSDALHLIVEDDGVGFDAQKERQRPYAERRFGLMGIEERVTQLAGTLTIETTPGNGTTVFVSLPLANIT